MEQEEAIKELKTLLKPLNSVYTTVTKVSRSGLSRRRNGDKKPETDGGYLLKQRWL